MKRKKEFHIDVTCPVCKYEEKNKVYKLIIPGMNSLNYTCPKCGNEVHTAGFYVSKDWKKKKEILDESIGKKKPKKPREDGTLPLPTMGKPN